MYYELNEVRNSIKIANKQYSFEPFRRCQIKFSTILLRKSIQTDIVAFLIKFTFNAKKKTWTFNGGKVPITE